MTMKAALLEGLLKESLTPLTALQKYQTLSLSQRCGEYRRERQAYEEAVKAGRPTNGYVPLIVDWWVKLPNGKRVKCYRAI